MENSTNEPLLAAFAKVLRLRRTRAGLSQEELAHRAGKSMRYISLLETCRHQPSLSTLKGICDGIGVSMTDFIAEVEAELA
jgi:transcriptional regulator with XRE-family HTH domain